MGSWLVLLSNVFWASVRDCVVHTRICMRQPSCPLPGSKVRVSTSKVFSPPAFLPMKIQHKPHSDAESSAIKVQWVLLLPWYKEKTHLWSEGFPTERQRQNAALVRLCGSCLLPVLIQQCLPKVTSFLSYDDQDLGHIHRCHFKCFQALLRLLVCMREKQKKEV